MLRCERIWEINDKNILYNMFYNNNKSHSWGEEPWDFKYYITEWFYDICFAKENRSLSERTAHIEWLYDMFYNNGSCPQGKEIAHTEEFHNRFYNNGSRPQDEDNTYGLMEWFYDIFIREDPFPLSGEEPWWFFTSSSMHWFLGNISEITCDLFLLVGEDRVPILKTILLLLRMTILYPWLLDKVDAVLFGPNPHPILYIFHWNNIHQFFKLAGWWWIEDKIRQYNWNLPGMEVLHKALVKYGDHLLYNTILRRVEWIKNYINLYCETYKYYPKGIIISW